MKRISFFLFFGLLVFTLSSQHDLESFKFKKESSQLYFFKSGKKSDTISKKSGNAFYLQVPDSLKSQLTLDVENGKFSLSESNDSLVVLEFLPGLKYESVYFAEEKMKNNVPYTHYKFVTMMNGVSSFDKSRVRVRLLDKRRNRVLIENTYWYK